MAARRWRHGERGAALLIFLVLLLMGGLTYVVNNLAPDLLPARRTQADNVALKQARDALLGYALKFREAQLKDGQSGKVYGYLPLPDLGNSRNNNTGCTREGCDAANFAGNAPQVTVIGRLPWRMLGIPPLRDAHGECLWYAVSGSHQRIHQATPMNWDTLGQIDIVTANGTAALASALAGAHERPVAVIFAPGPPLPGQNRTNSTGDDVGECGGNYMVSNYLDPGSIALDGTANYFPGAANAASADTAAATKSMTLAGDVLRQADGRLWGHACPRDASCALAANDRGLAIDSATLFDALRKSAPFRTDINSMLERMAGCLRDGIAAGNGLPVGAIAGFGAPADKSAGRIADNACYDDTRDPLGYFSHYRDQIFVARPNVGNFSVSVDGIAQSCPAVLIFAGQRGAAQARSTTAERDDPANYLEDVNLASFTNPGTSFSGPSLFARIGAAHPAQQDIVRCLAAGANLATVESTRLTTLGVGQLTGYDAETQTLTLGRRDAESDLGITAGALFGCAWQPEARATGSGVRSYFKFNIQDTGTSGDGFVFALVDGDANNAAVCGAARQHLGYSGNNGYTASIAFPKIGIEVDTSRNYLADAAYTDPTGFDPSYLGAFPASTSHLNNGRADPAYTGGHVAIVYWGGETAISTGRSCSLGCVSPQFCGPGNICHLRAEEDDNVHGRSALPPASRPPPQNPVAPALPAAAPAGVYKLDPGLSQVPIRQDIHVRVEVTRTRPADDYNSRPVRVVATSNIALTGLPTIDGVALAEGNRVLVTAQSAGAENGVYVAAAGAWMRATTEDDIWDMPPGSAWIVKEGATNGWTYWRFNAPESYTLGSDALTIARATPSWRAVATAHIALVGLQSIAGVQLTENDRVLVVGQSSPAQNGLYLAKAGAWTNIPMYQGSYQTQAWILKQSATDADRIASMPQTTRPMSALDPAYTPHLSDSVTIYDPTQGACSSGSQCANGQWCGLDQICYRPGFRKIRLGFTIAQGTRDQLITVTDFASTWLP